MAQNDADMRVVVDAVTKPLERQLARATKRIEGLSRATDIHTRRSARHFKRTERAVNNMQRAVGTALGAIVAQASVREVIAYADAWTNAGNKVGTVAEQMGLDVNSIRDDLFALAQDTRSGFSGVVGTYQRFAAATADLGTSHKDLLAANKALNQSFSISGSTTQEASAASIQLAQGLASGRLAGDELRSVLEANVVFGGLLAKQMGVTRGELRDLGAEGKITADVVLAALIENSEELEKQFRKMTPTISQGFTVLRNGAARFVGETSDASGAAATFSKTLILLGDNIELVADLMVGMGVIALGRTLGPAMAKAGTSAFAYGQGLRNLKATTIAANDALLRKARAASAAAKWDARAATIAYNTAKANLDAATSADRRAVAEKRLEMATNQRALADRNVAATSLQVSAATRAAARGATMGAVAMRGFGAAVSLAGGPIGLLILGVSGLAYGLSTLPSVTDRATEATKGLSEALKQAGLNAGATADELKRLTDAQIYNLDVDLELNIPKQQSVIDAFLGKTGAFNSKLERAFNNVSQNLFRTTREQREAISKLKEDVLSGAIGIQDLEDKLQSLLVETNGGRGSSLLQGLLDALNTDQALAAKNAQKEIERLESLRERLQNIKGSPDQFFAQRGIEIETQNKLLEDQEKILKALEKLDKVRANQAKGLTQSEADLLDTLSVRAKELENNGDAAGIVAQELASLAQASGLARSESFQLIGRLDLLHPQFAEVAKEAQKAAQGITAASASAHAFQTGRGLLTDTDQGSKADEAANAYRNSPLYKLLQRAVPKAVQLNNELELVNDALSRQKELGLKPSQIEFLTQESKRLNKELGAAKEVIPNLTVGELRTNLDGAFEGLFDGSIKDWNSFEQHVLQGIRRIAAQKTAQSLTDNLFSIFGLKDGGAVKEFASGGSVRGRGGPRDDKILARLSNGEYVVNAKAAKKNRDLLDAINYGGLSGFRNGGLVGMPSSAGFAKANQIAANQNHVISAPISINIQSSGNAQLDANLARESGRAVEQSMEAVARRVYANMQRPGNRR